MRWDLIASPELQNWLNLRDGTIQHASRLAPFGTSGKSTRNYAASILNAVEQFGLHEEIVASNVDYNEWANGARRHLQARSDLGMGNARLWQLDGPPIAPDDRQIRWTQLGLEFYNRLIENELDEGVQENLGFLPGIGRDGPANNPLERLPEELRCFELLEAAHQEVDADYMATYDNYCRLRPFLPQGFLPVINQPGSYDNEKNLADFFHTMEWLNFEIDDYNPFLSLLDALENGHVELDLNLDEEVLMNLYGFNLRNSNWNDSWTGEYRNKFTPSLMWIHAMERMASAGVAPPMIEIEDVIDGEPVEHVPIVLGVVQDFAQNATQLLPDGIQLNPGNHPQQVNEQPNAAEPMPGDVYFVIRFVRDGNVVPRLLPLAKVGAAWPNQNNPDAPPSLLREVGARRETNYPLFDAEGRAIQHLTVARYECADTRGLEGSTGLRGHLDNLGFTWVRMDTTRQRENILLFGELNQDMSHITNEERAERLQQALQIMRECPPDGHWNNINGFEIVRPELLAEFGIEWDDEDDFVPWF